MDVFELVPFDGRKSFYGKAKVVIDEKGNKTLLGDNTPVLTMMSDGSLQRLWDGYSCTTGRHIAAFCGLSKREFMAMEVCRN